VDAYDGTMGPFDYKFAKAPSKPYRNQVIQSVLYGLLIEERYNVSVNRGYLCYTRDNFKVVEVEITDRRKKQAVHACEEVLQVIQEGFLPKGTSYERRCIDCCYRNICIQ
jgi:CRISPR-associated exonuclease Cas4